MAVATATASSSASAVEPYIAPPAPAAKAANSILPSSPRSTTPERSANNPARAHSTRGVAMRRVDGQHRSPQRLIHVGPLLFLRPATAPRLRRARSRTIVAPGKQYDEALQHHHHVAAEAADLERHLGPALVQRAEQQAGDHDAQRVVAARSGPPQYR